MSVLNAGRWLKPGDQAPKNPLYPCTALSLYKNGAGQSKETFLKAFLKIYFEGGRREMPILSGVQLDGSHWIFPFPSPYQHSYSLWLTSPAQGQGSYSRDVLPSKHVLCKWVLCWVKLTETWRYTKCQGSCFLGKKPRTQIVSTRKLRCLDYTHTHTHRRSDFSESQREKAIRKKGAWGLCGCKRHAALALAFLNGIQDFQG